MNNLIKTFLFVSGIILSCSSFGQYAGTYTVGGSNPDFKTLDSAFINLSKKGVIGSVRLNIRSGTYNERFIINKINGASNSYLIKVAPDPKNTMPVIIKNRNTTLTNNYILNIKQGFLRFDSLDFRLDSSSKYGKIVDFTATCENITFNFCTFSGKDTTVSDNDFASLFDPNTVNVNNYKVLNCKFYNGGCAISHQGTSASNKEKGFEMRNCKVLNFYREGIYLIYQILPLIEGSYFQDMNKLSTAIGIDISISDSVLISKNQINVNGGAGYGMYIYYAQNSTIVNNFINLYDSSRFGYAVGLYVEAGKNYRILYNSIRLVNEYEDSKAMLLEYISDCIFKNNNVVHLGKGYAHTAISLTGKKEMDYNNYYTAGTYLGFVTSSLSNLAAIRSASGMEKHSVNSKIKYKNSRDLHTSSSGLNAEAIVIADISTDIDGQKRDANNPDIGADEFDNIANDITLAEINISKVPLICGLDSTEISAVIKNAGNNTIGVFNIYLEISGSTKQKITYNYSDSLKSGQRDTINFRKFSTSMGGDFKFKAYTAFAKDADRNNDTIKDQRSLTTMASKPQAANINICDNKAYTLTTTHDPNTILRWYNSPGGKYYFDEGDILVNLKSDTNFYVSSVFQSMNKDSLTTTNTGVSTCAGGVMFDLLVKKTMLVDSFSAAVQYSSPQTISVYIRKNATHEGYETDPKAWTLVESVFVVPKSTSPFATIKLKKYLRLYKDSMYGIYLSYNAKYLNTPNSYSNNDLVIPGATGLSKTFGTKIKSITFNGTVYYRTGIECESERVKYNVKVNKAPYTYLGKDTAYCANSGIIFKLNAGSGFVSYRWSTGDTTQTITAYKDATYYVTVTDTNNCEDEDKLTITKYPSPKVDIGKDTAFCVNSGINYFLNAGSGFKSYKWTPAGVNQTKNITSAGIYSVVVVNDKNCQAGDTLTVTENKNPVVNLGNDTSYCSDKGIQLLLDAGAGYSWYNWSTLKSSQTINVTAGGPYSVIVTDWNSCKGSDEIFVFEAPKPHINLGNDTSICKGNSIKIKLDAGAGYFYQWSTNDNTQSIVVNSEGKYYVGVKSTYNCYGSDTIRISLSPNPFVDLGPDRILNPKLLINETLDAGSGFKVYQWSTSEKTPTIKATALGKYFVKVTDANGCTGTDTIELKPDPAGISLLQNLKITIYPNPAKDLINIVSDNSEIEKAEIFEISGKSVFKSLEKNKAFIINTGNWANGIYMLALTADGKTYKIKVSVQH